MADRRFICSCYSHAFIASATTRLASSSSSSSPSGSPNSKRQIHFTPPPRREIQPIKVRHCTAQFSFSFYQPKKSRLHLFPGHYSLDHSNCECHQSQRTPVDLAKGNDSWKTGKVKWDRFSMIFNKRRWIRLQLCKDPLGAILNFSLIYVIPNCMACKQCVTPPQPRAYHLPIGRGWWRSFALGGAGDSVHNRHRTGRRNLWLETFLSSNRPSNKVQGPIGNSYGREIPTAQSTAKRRFGPQWRSQKRLALQMKSTSSLSRAKSKGKRRRSRQFDRSNSRRSAVDRPAIVSICTKRKGRAMGIGVIRHGH